MSISIISGITRNICASKGSHGARIMGSMGSSLSTFAKEISSKRFCSQNTNSPPEASLSEAPYKIWTNAEKGECALQLTSPIPRKVWIAVHEIFVSHDFTWKQDERLWTSSSTLMAEKALEQVREYLDETRPNFKEISIEEKKAMMDRWLVAEDAYIASQYPELHGDVKKLLEKSDPTQEKSEKPERLISSILNQSKSLLPQHVNQTRFLTLLEESLGKIENLSELDPQSVRKAAFMASILGLEPGGLSQQCVFIPFDKKIVFILGYRGLIELSMRTGDTLFFEAKCVYKQDRFEATELPLPMVRHSPHPVQKERGEISQVYARRVLKNGDSEISVLNFEDVKKIRKVARDLKNPNSVWFSWTEEMGLKTAVKSLAKQTELNPNKTKPTSP